MTDAARAITGPDAGTVLNVNDHAPHRYVVSKMLLNAGYRVLEVDTGLAAVEMALEQHPDVVVLDIQLPDISGMEVCRRLKESGVSGAPLVVHTSATFASAEIRVKGLDVGGDAFLAQPFTAQELVATVRALVRRRRVEEEQRRRAEELAEADRRKDDFLAMLGHELRNPLNALSMSQAIVEHLPARDDQEAHARAVARRQTAHLTRLVNDLLEVSRVTRGKIPLSRAPLDLVEVLRETVSVMEETALGPRRQQLRLSVPDERVLVDGDRVRLGQVFSNLVENASKYSPEDTSIDLDLDLVPREDGIDAVVTITDRGQGISGEQIGHVFSLFYQAQPTEARIGTGLGIGLTLVRSLVELHGGSVAVRSEGRGRGSEFDGGCPRDRRWRCRSRRCRAAPTVDAAGHARCARRAHHRGQPRCARAARDALPNSGFAVSAVANGLDGVAEASRLKPAVSLVDIGLPGIDGYEVARRLRAAPDTAGLVLVALTGYGLPAQRERALSAGFDLHLVKPVDPDVLMRLLEEPHRTVEMLGAAAGGGDVVGTRIPRSADARIIAVLISGPKRPANASKSDHRPRGGRVGQE
ncbi:MAG: response regulator [Vicinamibacterales bacterium]